MGSRGHRVVRSWGCIGVVIVALGGCATTQTTPEGGKPEEVVKARAQARWDAVTKEDFATAYGYLSPGSRSVNSLEAYRIAVPKAFYKEGRVESVTCSGPDTCETQVRVEYEFKGKRFKTPLAETWIRQEGNWWYVLK